jgi:hypothetical protein
MWENCMQGTEKCRVLQLDNYLPHSYALGMVSTGRRKADDAN